jgi:Uma2 family endonuclease
MASAISAPPITIEQYLGFESPEGYHDELINGRIVVSPDPKPLHLDVAENLFLLLRAAAGEAYKVGQRINLRFGHDNSMPSPDVFVMNRAAWNEARASNTYPSGSDALLVIEVVSAGNRRSALKMKADLYLKHAIELWVVHPDKREIRLYRPGQPIQIIAATNDTAIPLPAAFPNVSIQLADIFRA